MIKRGATNLAVLALGTALALASFEGAVRLVFPTFDRSGQFDFTYTVAGNLVLGQPGAVARQQKNTGDFDVIVRIGPRGLRDDKDVAGATVDDIAVVGDSFAWGWGIEDGERFSDILQGLLGRRVYNVSAPTNLTGYAALLDYAQALGGRFGRAVVAVCMENDLYDYDTPQPPPAGGAAEAGWELREWLDRNSAAYFLVTATVHQTPWLERIAVRSGVITPNIEGIARNVYSEAAIESSARKVAELALKSPKLLVVIIPSRGLWAGNNRAVEEQVHTGFVVALARRGIDVLDLRPLWKAGGRPLDYHFANDGHWNARGHRLAAEAIARRLAGN